MAGDRYKSWSGLKKELESRLCDGLRGHVAYFLTRYHDVHNAYGRASIRIDGKELVCFSWTEVYRQDADANELWKETGVFDYNDPELVEKWNRDGTFSDYDFLDAATEYLRIPIGDALASDNPVIRIFAILDRRVGMRTLNRIKEDGKYLEYPEWVRQFFELRFRSGSMKGDEKT